MEPLSQNDPLHKLLGKARPVEPRPNFTQNVLRAVRQTPQSLGLWERMQAWLGGWGMPRVAFAGAVAVIAVLALAVFAWQKPGTQEPVVAVQPAAVTPAPQGLAQPTALHEVSAAMILAATAEVAATPAPAAATDDMDPMEALFVHQDTSALSDTELALLVY